MSGSGKWLYFYFILEVSEMLRGVSKSELEIDRVKIKNQLGL